ncbi:MAG: tetratricopeptide repeat protein [Ignavibacteria bacterium]
MKNFLFSLAVLCSISDISFSQDLSSEEIFSRTKDAIVVIYAYDYNGQKNSQGSGVIIKDRGIVVTNFHVFAGNEKLEIKHNDSTISYSEIVGVDIDKDILILKLDENDFPSIPVGKVEDIKIGQKVYAIGSPMGLENTISDGLVSGMRNLGEEKKQNYIQITASLSPGSSGGAVLNSKGELIGISTMGYEKGQNLNFAIGIDDIYGVTLGEYNDKKKLEALNYFFKGKNLHEEGKYKEAIDYYTKYMKIFPADSKAFNFRGLAYEDHKEYKKAISDFTQAIKIDPKYEIAYANRGECYFKIGENDKSIKDFTQVIKLDPENTSAYYGRGLISAKEEDWRDAVNDFSKVIDKDPYYVQAYVNRGLAYYWLSDYEMAIIDWKKCIKMDPNLAPALNQMIDQADILWQYHIK